jgi:tyrosyl-tRNA synthetase
MFSIASIDSSLRESRCAATVVASQFGQRGIGAITEPSAVPPDPGVKFSDSRDSFGYLKSTLRSGAAALGSVMQRPDRVTFDYHLPDPRNYTKSHETTRSCALLLVCRLFCCKVICRPTKPYLDGWGFVGIIQMNLFDEFKWRGMVQDTTPELPHALASEKLTAYIGFDPTAASLHVGSLLPVMALARLQRFGHTPIAVAGGGTGLIGDPSGKTLERQLLTNEMVEKNLEGIRQQLARFLDFDTLTNPARIINNADWLVPISAMEFLRDVGKYFTVNYLLAKESVKRRLETEDGMSFTEFSYSLLQAYDYLVLHDRYGCLLQMGGSDQWGNILAGIDLIRRLRGAKAHGLVFPLVKTTAGVKFGKTEAGAVWLDPNLTSPYHFYQFWLNIDDRDVINYLKFFTWISRDAIQELEDSVRTEPHTRKAQKELARLVTEIVHGETALANAVRASEVLFGKEVDGLSAQEITDIFADVPSTQLERLQLEGDGLPLVDLLVITGVAPSKAEARRLIQAGGVFVNNRRVNELRKVVISEFIENEILILRKGPKSYHLIRVI